MTYSIVSSDLQIMVRDVATPFSHTVLSFQGVDGGIIAEINGLATSRDGAIRTIGFAIRGDRIMGYIADDSNPTAHVRRRMIWNSFADFGAEGWCSSVSDYAA